MRATRRQSASAMAASMTLGLVLGTVWVAHADQDRDQAEPTPTAVVATPSLGPTTDEWPRNAAGLTVGTPTESDRQTGNLPDLTPVHADNGRAGFIRADRYFFPDPKDPAEAVAQMKALVGDDGLIDLVVYAADGRTEIGTLVAAEVSEGSSAKLP